MSSFVWASEHSSADCELHTGLQENMPHEISVVLKAQTAADIRCLPHFVMPLRCFSSERIYAPELRFVGCTTLRAERTSILVTTSWNWGALEIIYLDGLALLQRNDLRRCLVRVSRYTFEVWLCICAAIGCSTCPDHC